MSDVGRNIYRLAERLFPICRSITGDGVRQTLGLIGEIVPQLQIHEIPTGTQVFDWTVPKEWNIRDACIEDLDGNRIISFSDNNLHVMGYSAPVDRVVSRNELLDMVYTQPDQFDAIPYVTSYYCERSGFCMSERQKQSLILDEYHIVIDSELKDGHLTYGEVLIPGETEQEIFISTYICHPSMANNEVSGPSVATYLIKWVQEQKRKYSYRFVFIPETIGSLVYLSRNIDIMKRNMVAGFNISCVGDDRTFSYVASRYGDNLADKAVKNILSFFYPEYKSYSFLHRGSDERQYCAPGIDLPVCTVCRSQFREYPEYHTSMDNMDIISPAGLEGAFNALQMCIEALEKNGKYKIQCLGEPQLGKRGLFSTISQKGSCGSSVELCNFIAYADGTNDLFDISNIIGVPVNRLLPIVDTLLTTGLIRQI